MKKIVLTLFLFILIQFCSHARTSKGTEFWIGYMENLNLAFNGPPKFTIQVSSNVATTGILSVPYTGFTQSFTVAANQVTLLTLPQGIYYPQGDEAIAINGIKITAADPVEVYAFHFRAYFTVATLILPITELGTDYLAIAQKDTMGISPSELIVVATQDSTIVEIIPSAVTVSTRPVGVPFTVTLQKGQVFQLQAYEELTGTSVKSLSPSKKIAVFGGSRQANVGCMASADDHVYDQVYPVSAWDTSYVLIPFLNHYIDVFKIVASVNNTTVTVSNGSSYTLNKGQFVNLFLSATAVVTASNPIAVAQLSTSQDCSPSMSILGDASMVVLTPDHLVNDHATFYTPSTYGFAYHHLNILVRTNAINAITLDNVSIASSFNPVPSAPAFSFAQLTLDTLGTLEHSLVCDSGFNATAYAFSFYNAYSYHLGFSEFTLTGFNEYHENSPLFISPNPVTDFLAVRGEGKILSVTVYNSLGKEVDNVKTYDNNQHIHVSSLPAGVYYLKLTFENKTEPQTKRFVKL